jgi:hypothetical protein
VVTGKDFVQSSAWNHAGSVSSSADAQLCTSQLSFFPFFFLFFVIVRLSNRAGVEDY